MDVERTFHVDRPVEDVFDYLADFENATEWDPGTLECERVSGDGGVGTTYRNRSSFMNRTVDLEYTTLAHERPGHVVLRGVNGKTTATDHLTFVPDGTGTRIHYRAVFDFPVPLRWVAPLFVRRPLERLADETVASIRSSISARPA